MKRSGNWRRTNLGEFIRVTSFSYSHKAPCRSIFLLPGKVCPQTPPTTTPVPAPNATIHRETQRNRFKQGDREPSVLRRGYQTAVEASGGQAQSTGSCRGRAGIRSLHSGIFTQPLSAYAKLARIVTVGPAVSRPRRLSQTIAKPCSVR